MGIILTKSDFTGQFAIPKNINDNIDSFITDNEEQYIIDLLGTELSDLFIADLVNKVPATDIYLKIYNKFTEVNGCLSYTSKGLKYMLLGLLYFDITRDNNSKNTTSGLVNNVVEVSTKASDIPLFRKHNNAITTYKSIQQYILKNITDYPTFKGINKKYSSPF